MCIHYVPLYLYFVDTARGKKTSLIGVCFFTKTNLFVVANIQCLYMWCCLQCNFVVEVVVEEVVVEIVVVEVVVVEVVEVVVEVVVVVSVYVVVANIQCLQCNFVSLFATFSIEWGQWHGNTHITM